VAGLEHRADRGAERLPALVALVNADSRAFALKLAHALVQGVSSLNQAALLRNQEIEVARFDGSGWHGYPGRCQRLVAMAGSRCAGYQILKIGAARKADFGCRGRWLHWTGISALFEIKTLFVVVCP
jgi:hypothetical protein